MLRAVLGALLVTFLTAMPAFSHDVGPVASRHFHLEWDIIHRPDGRPFVAGFVHNGHGFYAERVALLVEAFDDGGRVVGRTYGYLPAGVPAFGHAYFALPAPAAGTRYRVSVAAYHRRVLLAP
jgi:hypothetical protein